MPPTNIIAHVQVIIMVIHLYLQYGQGCNTVNKSSLEHIPCTLSKLAVAIHMHSMYWWPLPILSWACAVESHQINYAKRVGAVGKPQLRWTENALFVVHVSHIQQFESHRKQFSPISTDLVCLQKAQMPKIQDLARFLPTTTDKQTNHFNSCACTLSN